MPSLFEYIPYRQPWIDALLQSDPALVPEDALVRERIYLKVPDSEACTIALPLSYSARWYIEVGQKATVHLKIHNESKVPSNSVIFIGIGCASFVSVSKDLIEGMADDISTRIVLQREATYQERYYSSSSLTKNSLHATLAGARSVLRIKNLAVVPSLGYAGETIHIEHAAEKTHSFVLHKAVVSDSGHSSFHSCSRLLAPQSISHSYVHHLTLGDHVHIQARPTFEIFHDDVEASHGCTSKEIDDQFLFYALSRGIYPNVAKQLYIEGFCNEILRNNPRCDTL